MALSSSWLAAVVSFPSTSVAIQRARADGLEPKVSTYIGHCGSPVLDSARLAARAVLAPVADTLSAEPQTSDGSVS